MTRFDNAMFILLTILLAIMGLVAWLGGKR